MYGSHRYKLTTILDIEIDEILLGLNYLAWISNKIIPKW